MIQPNECNRKEENNESENDCQRMEARRRRTKIKWGKAVTVTVTISTNTSVFISFSFSLAITCVRIFCFCFHLYFSYFFLIHLRQPLTIIGHQGMYVDSSRIHHFIDLSCSLRLVFSATSSVSTNVFLLIFFFAASFRSNFSVGSGCSTCFII